MASTIAAGTTTTTALVYSADTSGVLQLQTNGTTTAVTIDTSQRVGIGTSSPQQILDTRGAFTLSSSNTNFATISRAVVPSGSVGLYLTSGTNKSESGNPTLTDETSSGGASIVLSGNPTDSYGGSVNLNAYGTGSNGNLIIFNRRTGTSTIGESGRFDTSGNLLVGLTSYSGYASTAVPKFISYGGSSSNNTIQTFPVGAALINGFNGNSSGYGISLKFHFSASEPGKYAAIAGVADAIYANATALAFYTTNSSAGGSDNVTQKMYIAGNGSIGAPSGTNIYNASDVRLKQNIKDLTVGLNAVLSLRAVSYNWVTDFCPVENDKTLYGFVAQEVQDVDINLIEKFGDSDVVLENEVIENPLRVNEKFIIPMLVKAIQELSAQVTTLQSQVAALTPKA